MSFINLGGSTNQSIGSYVILPLSTYDSMVSMVRHNFVARLSCLHVLCVSHISPASICFPNQFLGRLVLLLHTLKLCGRQGPKYDRRAAIIAMDTKLVANALDFRSETIETLPTQVCQSPANLKSTLAVMFVEK